MRTVGLPISHKENERRRALLPVHIGRIQNKGLIYIEEGYGEVLGFADEDYLKEGIRVVTREEVLTKDIICDPKIGDAEYLSLLEDQILFGWIHAVQSREITDMIIDRKLTVLRGKICMKMDGIVFGGTMRLPERLLSVMLICVMVFFHIIQKLPF